MKYWANGVLINLQLLKMMMYHIIGEKKKRPLVMMFLILNRQELLSGALSLQGHQQTANLLV